MPRAIASKLAVLAVLGLALLAAGCGGGGASKEDFQAEMVAVRDRVDSALEQVTNASSVDDLLARLRIAAAEVRSAATDAAEAEAPDEFEDEQRNLANTLRAFSEELVATVTTLEVIDTAAASTRGFDFENWTKTQSRLAELRRAGIDVRPLEKH